MSPRASAAQSVCRCGGVLYSRSVASLRLPLAVVLKNGTPEKGSRQQWRSESWLLRSEVVV